MVLFSVKSIQEFWHVLTDNEADGVNVNLMLTKRTGKEFLLFVF